MEKVKLSANVLFSGLGCQERGIKDTNLFDLDVVCTSDIDKDVIVSYAALHCGLTKEMIKEYKDYPTREEMIKDLSDRNIGYDFKKNKPYNWSRFLKKPKNLKSDMLKKYWLAMKLSNNLGDISGIQELPYADLWTVSFPCTDISISGQMKGLSQDSNTRSSLLWQQIRLLKTSIDKNEAPKYLMFENVKNLVSKKFINDFNDLLSVLDELGYNSYWEVINAKNCGIPQNRERVFVICIRKDIDKKQMTFPKPFDNGLRLKDVLDDIVDEKYYINNDKADKLIDELIENGTLGNSDESYPIASRGRYSDESHTEQNLEVRDEPVANSLTTVQKDSMCLKYERTEEGKALRKDYESHKIKHGFNEHRQAVPRQDGMTNTISTVQKDNMLVERERVSCPSIFQSTTQERLTEQTVLQQDTMVESQESNNIVPVLLSEKGSKFEKELDYSSTLLARDYKGFGNQAMTGVIENRKDKS